MVIEKKKCCGCGACVYMCPERCISMVSDDEGFLYPSIDTVQCIRCGKCNAACHMVATARDRNINYPVKAYCAFSTDDAVLFNSSSGGMFYHLAEWVIAQSGTVYGARQIDAYTIVHDRADNMGAILPLQKSKYLQSNMSGIYGLLETDLKEGRPVLFVGTPCQAAAVRHIFGNKYRELYLCDLVCHGVPSSAVFRRYIEELDESKGGVGISHIEWRDKRKGWYPNSVTVYFNNEESISTSSKENSFQTGFLSNIYLRPSCYNCHYAQIPRVADVSLADFWGYTGSLTPKNANKGLSAVILSSPKGDLLFQAVADRLVYESVGLDYLKMHSRHVANPPAYNSLRKLFFRDFYKGLSIGMLNKKYVSPSLVRKVINKLYKVLLDRI